MSSRIGSVLMVALLMVGPLFAGAGKGHHQNQKAKGKAKHAHKSDSSVAIDIGVALGEYRQAVRHYVDHEPSGSLPPGLAKRGGNLPPGLAKHLHKNGTLPPGLQKRVSPFPAGLSGRLPYLGDDYDAGFLSGRVVIFNKRTSAILDVFVP